MTVNLIDPQSIDTYLDSFLPSDPVAATHLKTALARMLARRPENTQVLRELPEDAPEWLRKKWPNGGPYHRFEPNNELNDKVRHIADWLKIAVQDDDPWLHQLETNGQPKRLLHLTSLEEATAEADRDMHIRNRRLAIQLGNGHEGEEMVAAMADGFRIVKLTTPEALDREGVKMGHCIGQGAYDEDLLDGTSEFYSLRDSKNQPHATLQIHAEKHAVVQCQGKGNKAPVPRYLPYLQAFLRTQQYSLHVPANRCGLIQAWGRYYDITNLPENLTVPGNLDLTDTTIDRLPKGLRVKGNLSLSHMPIAQLPEGLNVGGNLIITKTSINLPNRLRVGGGLFIGSTAIRELPADLQVGGTLNLANTQISQIPDGMKVVGGDLLLNESEITTLPMGLQINGHCNLNRTKIAELPEGLSVGTDLWLAFSHVKRLPDRLCVGQSIILEGSHITELPENLNVNNSLYLSHTAITKLPPGLRVGCSLDLSSSHISELPTGLHVPANLDLSHTSITKLPDDLRVDGNLDLSGTPIAKLPEGLKVGGKIIGFTPEPNRSFAGKIQSRREASQGEPFRQ